MVLIPITRMRDRLAVERSDSDASLFTALMYEGEFVLKLAVSGLIAAISDDRERHSYRQVHRLVRADGLGEWSQALDEVLLGPAAQYLDLEARESARQLTQNCRREEWQFQAVSLMRDCLSGINTDTENLGGTVQCRRWFRDFVRLRNDTRAHGAPNPTLLSGICPSLEKSIDLFVENFDLFKKPWAYLYRNLSGKYRVTNWGSTSESLELLKRTTSIEIDNGVYLQLASLQPVGLVASTPDLEDVWIANGTFTEAGHELISYITNDRFRRSSENYLSPIEQLPPSETEGLGQLDVQGNCFANVPFLPPGYVPRADLQNQLLEQLHLSDRHPIVTLTGGGGIGKTFLTLRVVHSLLENDPNPFQVIIWFSARDIDLTSGGPKSVQPQTISLSEMAQEYVRLLGPQNRNEKGFNPVEFFAGELAHSLMGPVLFIFDNFETTTNPGELFSWIDTFARLPNKILITSRDRRFTGDYALRIEGMTHEEAVALINGTASEQRISDLLTKDYIEEIVRESGGHPYVIKLLIGEVAKSKKLGVVERIIASQEDTLLALFERSYSNLSPAAKRVFLTLCNWYTSIPAVALEATLLRPENERINVKDALEELYRTSFVEEIPSDVGDETEINVPLAARLFGVTKLESSSWRASIQADTQLLHLFGAARPSSGRPSLEYRINRLFTSVARSVSVGERQLKDVLPILNFIATRYPMAWIHLVDLLEELDESFSDSEKEKYLLRYVEKPDWERLSPSTVWNRIAEIRRTNGDIQGALYALAQICRQSGVTIDVLSNTANRINNMLYTYQTENLTYEKQFLLQDVVWAMESRVDELDATDCSRLTWLYVHLEQIESARQTARYGLEIHPDNEHCRKVLEKLSTGYYR